ncbi:MAG TPA: phosphoribosylamine--glycine ligase [Elusimicrobiota bacterium]|jgi:phosphoribosylamine--glycine ligase|nr:phosphoribosylamine--glycine ligase [Elusimicrobiota bacterium]
MIVLLLGSGGREHALAWAIKKSPRLEKLYAAPGSDAIAELAERVPLDPLDGKAVAEFCAKAGVSLVVIGPEAPLAAGVADVLRAAGVSVFGPGKAAAQLESSKAFAKDFMRRHRIPTARFATFTDAAKAKAALPEFGLPVVVKADGLAAGKGVRVCATLAEAQTALDDFMSRGALGEAGRRVVLEEALSGPEASWLGFCDGKNFLPLPPSQDHKRLKDGDLGPNTGGMGVFAPTPTVTPAVVKRIRAEIADQVLIGLAKDGLDFRGLLYIGLMLTRDGPKVIEFNARFGDPETQAVLPLLQEDVLSLLEKTAEGKLKSRAPRWKGASVCVVLASEGYPDKPATGRAISGLDDPALSQALVFHAGTKKEGNVWKTAGGRVLGITAVGETLEDARAKAYAAADKIRFEGLQLRRDICGQAAAPAGSRA